LSAEVLFGVLFNNDSVFRHLLLDKQYFFDTINNEVATGVIRALFHSCQLFMSHIFQPAIAGTEHHWHLTNYKVSHPLYLSSHCVLNLNIYGCLVSHIPDPALVRHHLPLIVTLPLPGLPNAHLIKLEVELMIVLTGHHAVGADDLLDAHIQEVVEGVNVLLNQASQTQEGWHQLPLVLQGFQRLRQPLRVVQLLEVVVGLSSCWVRSALLHLHFSNNYIE